MTSVNPRRIYPLGIEMWGGGVRCVLAPRCGGSSEQPRWPVSASTLLTSHIVGPLCFHPFHVYAALRNIYAVLFMHLQRTNKFFQKYGLRCPQIWDALTIPIKCTHYIFDLIKICDRKCESVPAGRTCWEHTDSTHKDPWWWESNLQPACCTATVLTQLKQILNNKLKKNKPATSNQQPIST